MKIALVVPHIFMHRDILPDVIFSPGTLALDLAETLQRLNEDVTLFSPGPVDTTVRNATADLSFFDEELRKRNLTYTELLKLHAFTFVTLARQVQSELLADVFERANRGEFDVVHIYTNEEDIALPFAQFCKVPVVFTHHDPFNFMLKYQSVFPKYKHLNWLSMSQSQRKTMPTDTNWVGTIYHGLPQHEYSVQIAPSRNYVAYLGRIIKAKGVHLAIESVRAYNNLHPHDPITLKIAGKHYAGNKDRYWLDHIKPHIDNGTVEFVGFLRTTKEKQKFLGNAKVLMIPSLFDEPFGMVTIEALACGTPVIGLRSGAIPEIIENKKTGFLVDKPLSKDTTETVSALASAIEKSDKINRSDCRDAFDKKFTTTRMAEEHRAVYKKLLQNN